MPFHEVRKNRKKELSNDSIGSINLSVLDTVKETQRETPSIGKLVCQQSLEFSPVVLGILGGQCPVAILGKISKFTDG
jgi:hypothetical protein